MTHFYWKLLPVLRHCEMAPIPRSLQQWVRLVRSMLKMPAPRRRGGMRKSKLTHMTPSRRATTPWRAWLRFVKLLLVRLSISPEDEVWSVCGKCVASTARVEI